MLYPPVLTEELVLSWADAHFERTGEWPIADSGPIPETEALWAAKTPVRVFEPRIDTWLRIDAALRTGNRGLSGGRTLAQLLEQRRGARNRKNVPALRTDLILQWATEHHQRTGRWPTCWSGEIAGSGGETWGGFNVSLVHCYRSLTGRTTLAQLLAENGLTQHPDSLPKLDIDKILQWVDAYHTRNKTWPDLHSGDIPEAEGETWLKVNTAMHSGVRGLRPGSSLAKLLAETRGRHNRRYPTNLTVEVILAWADDHFNIYGQFPGRSSGQVHASPEESWSAIYDALAKGTRGLPGGSSLPKIFEDHRGIPRKGGSRRRSHTKSHDG